LSFSQRNDFPQLFVAFTILLAVYSGALDLLLLPARKRVIASMVSSRRKLTAAEKYSTCEQPAYTLYVPLLLY
jgi:hypothetical protein